VRYLLKLLLEETPAVRCAVRGGSYATIVYGCGDTSGPGFGDSAFMADGQNDPFYRFDNEIAYWVSIWDSDSDNISSNFRELRNVVESIEDQVEKGWLKNRELFMFTDNSTAEKASYRGSSSNQALFELVLRLKKLEMLAGLNIHLVHISGHCMIADGMDNISRGSLTEGIMSGIPFLDFFPLNEMGFERSTTLLDEFKVMLPRDDPLLLEPNDWFEKGHDINGWYKNKKGCWHP
jgi:hypothetical protein